MTDPDNLLKTVHFGRPDHIPMKFHINPACWHHYPQDALQELMAGHPLLFPDFEPSELPLEVEIPPSVRAGVPYVDPWGCVWETRDDGITGTVTRHPLESWEQFDRFKPPDPDSFTHSGPIDWEQQKNTSGPCLSQSCIPSGEIGHNHTWLKLTDIRGYQNAIYDMTDEEPRLLELLQMIEEFNMGLLRHYIELGIGWMGFAEDLGMQVGPMLSPLQFRKYIKPSYQRLMRKAKGAGCIVHVHADGDLRTLIDDLLECGLDIINLQDLVNGLDWIKERLAGRTCIELDLDRQRVTFGGTPAQIDNLVRREVDLLGDPAGGLMMIYGLYPGIPLENAKAVMDAMERYTDYYR